MKTKVITTIMITLFLASMMVIAIPVKADPTEWHVYWPGPIQAAVDAASPGDTIIVHPGIYEETVIFRSGIAGWTNPWYPDFVPMHDITIHHNHIHDNWDGINIGAFVWATWSPPSWRHHRITIHHNVIEHNHYRGIDLWSVSESTVAHNEILDNGGDWNGNGIFDEAADDMNGNGVTDGDGMTWVYVSDSTATHNKIEESSEVGLSMNQATGNTVTYNDVTDNLNLGIALFGWGVPTTGNTFVWNDARGNVSWDMLCYLKWGSMVYGNKWVKNQYDDASPIPLV